MSVSSSNLSRQNLLIIVSEKHLSSVIKEITSNLPLIKHFACQIITLGYLPFKKPRGDELPCRNIDSYFVEQDHYSDYGQAIKISQQWFLTPQGDDVTIYDGVSIGVVLQRWMIVFYNNFLSNMRTAARVLEEENPDEIWLCMSKPGKKMPPPNEPQFFMEVFSSLAASRNIACKKKILHGKPSRITSSRALRAFLHKQKSLVYSLVIRKLIFFVKYDLLMRRRNSLVNILLPSPQSPNYIGKAVIDKLLNDKKKNLLVWKGETLRQKVNLIDVTPPFFSRLGKNDKEIIMRIEKQVNSFIELSRNEKIKNTSCLLKQVYRDQIAPLVKDIVSDIRKLETFFKRVNIHLVFCHTDTTIKERTVVSVANRYKVPSIVLQHGVAGHYWGIFPLIATRFAAWGEIIEKWFARNGVGKDRVCVTGAANFDSYIQQISHSKKNGKAHWKGISNYLLYITVRGKNFSTGFKVTRQDNELLLDAILGVVGTMPEKMLVIKVKPGDPQTQFYKSEIGKRELKNVCVIERTDNGKLLNACGVLLTTYSTMALEALFFNKPIIQLKFVNKKKLMKRLYEQNILCDEEIIPLQKYGVALGVDSPEELKKAILKVYEDKSIRKSLIDRGKVFLEKYGYASDGNASLRMMSCIEEMLRRSSSHGR